MVRALGYSSTSFVPSRPGRLCRGRERWIAGWEVDEDDDLFRLVVSGAEFSDDSARDATRGLNRAGVDVGRLLASIFPGRTLLAFKEDGYFGELPDFIDPDDDEAFFTARQGGAWFDPCQRWQAVVDDPAKVSSLVGADQVDGFLVFNGPVAVDEALRRSLFLFTGQGDDTAWPVERFQPLAMAELLQRCEAVVCVHLDKHGPALGIYSADPIDVEDELRKEAELCGILAVPFAIPPMLARWDRALQELRHRWMATRGEEFPVPPADEPTRWSRRSRRGRRGYDEE